MLYKHYLTLTRSRDHLRQNRLVNLMTRTIKSLCRCHRGSKNVPIFLWSEVDVMKQEEVGNRHTRLVNSRGSRQESSYVSVSITFTYGRCHIVPVLPLCSGVRANRSSVYASFDLMRHKNNKPVVYFCAVAACVLSQ